jgi:hypothetical protein
VACRQQQLGQRAAVQGRHGSLCRGGLGGTQGEKEIGKELSLVHYLICSLHLPKYL